MERTTIDYGIDLGTTNSLIARIDGVSTAVIPNKVGSMTTPSAVWIDKRGRTHVGLEAKHKALVSDPENADLEFKLRMGLGSEARKLFQATSRELLPEELSAEVLKSLKTDVTEVLRAAVITVPAAFENPQTNATQKAARLAGFAHSPLLLEPVAASLAYGFQSEKENVYWLVYDFGGGTFDAAVMRIRDGLIQVVNHDGDNFLGGKLLDWDIVTKLFAPALAKQQGLAGFQRGNKQWSGIFGHLKLLAETAKIEVCRTREPYDVFVENLADGAGKQFDFHYQLTPQEVAQVSAPYVERSMALCRNTLAHVGITGKDLDRVLMVGGTTLNPWVREAVQKELGCSLDSSVDPITVVARGAAIFASTQTLPRDTSVAPPPGTWSVEIDHKPVGNVPDPDIGGKVKAPAAQAVTGCTIEFVDRRTSWRSGRLTLGAEGVFMTQLYAEKHRKHDYEIELCDPRGTRLPCTPQQVSYTIGVIPEENPPAVMTISVGLANGSVAEYVKKGDKLPVRKRLDHVSALPLRAGRTEDLLRIPLLEGEHQRAERNHRIGLMEIRGTDLRRDLPVGSPIEITVLMDKDQKVTVLAFVETEDREFDASFEPQMGHNSLDQLVQEKADQEKRLTKVREDADRTLGSDALVAVQRIDGQQLLSQIDGLTAAAKSDPDAVAQLDRLLRQLAAAIDKAEDAAEWPKLVEQANKNRDDARGVVEKYGLPEDKTRLAALERGLQLALERHDPDVLRRFADDFDVLYFRVYDRQPGYHVACFERYQEQQDRMGDKALAAQLFAQGRRAIDTNDVDALKAANRQLAALLPREEQGQKHVNVGGTMVRG